MPSHKPSSGPTLVLPPHLARRWDEPEARASGRSISDDPTWTYRSPGPPAPTRRRRTLGRYSLVECIGRGGMGVVFSAFDPELARPVAIKIVHPRSSLNPRYRDALLHDARAAARVTHPAVVQVHDWGTEDDEAFVVMELVEGSTLKKWLQRKPRHWQDVLRMFVRAGQGLQAVHDHGLIHRDFKPSNVLIDSRDAPHVADFGLARPYESTLVSSELHQAGLDRAATSARVAGTPRYMAPEQFTDEDVGPHSDQFAFCVCLYESLFGVHPLLADDGMPIDHATVARLHRTRRDRLRPAVPRRVVQAILRGLAMLPEDRHPSVGALVAKLEASTRERRWLTKTLAMGAVALMAACTESYLERMRDAQCVAASQDVYDRLVPSLKRAERRMEEIKGHDHPLAVSISSEMNRLVDELSKDTKIACYEGQSYDPSIDPPCPAIIQLERLFDRLAVWDSDLLLAQEFILGFDPAMGCVSGLASPSGGASLGEMLEQLNEAQIRLLHNDWNEARQLARDAADRAQKLGLNGYRASAMLVEALGLIEEGMHDEGVDRLQSAASLISPDKAPRLRAKLTLTEIQARLLATDRPNEEFRRRMEQDLEKARQQVVEAGSPPDLMAQRALTEAELHLLSGRTRESVDTYHEAMQHLREVHPPTSRRSALLAHNLSVALLAQGEPEQAEATVREALETLEALDEAPRHPGLAPLHRMLGMLLATRGQTAEAQAELEAALALLDGDDDASRKEILSIRQSLAVMLYDRGQLDAAMTTLEEVLEDQVLAFGEQSVELLWTLDLLAEVNLDAGEPERARHHAERRLQLAERAYGDAHPHYALAQMMLGKVLLALGADVEAGPPLHRAYAMLWESQADPMWRAESAFHHARHLHRSGHVEQARVVLTQARTLIASLDQAQRLIDEMDRWTRAHPVSP